MMKKILSLAGLMLMLCIGHGQAPGSKLPAIDPSKANKETKKLPTINAPKPTTQGAKPTQAKTTRTENAAEEGDPGCDVGEIYVSQINFSLADQLIRTSLSFHGGTRLTMALALKTGDMALLNHIPDLFDKSNHPLADCLGMVNDLEASTLDKKSVSMQKPGTFYEYAPGFACLPASLPTKGTTSFLLKKPADKVKTGGYMFWFNRNYSGEFVYPDWQEITFSNNQVLYDLAQPEGDAVAGIFVGSLQGSSQDVVIYGVAQKVNGKWMLSKVTEEPGTHAQPIRRPDVTPALSATGSSRPAAKPQVVSTHNPSESNGRGFSDQVANERDYSNNAPDPRDAGGESPRDHDRGGDAPEGGRN